MAGLPFLVGGASVNEKQSICSAVRSFAVSHGRLCRVGFVLLAALGSVAPALALGPPTLKADANNPASVKATLSVQGLAESGDPNFSTTAGVVFPDGYPAPFGPFPGGRGTFSGSVYWHNDGGQSCSRLFDTSSAVNKSFGYSDFTVGVYDYDTNSGQNYSATVPGTQTVGTSVCMVVAPDPNKPGSFIPLPGVVLTMFKQYTDASPINGRPWGKSLTLGLRSTGGSSLTYGVFGIDKTNTIKTDAPYPSGLSTDTFAFVAHLDGYKDVTNIGAVNARPGTAWPGVAMLLILQPNSSPSDSSASPDGVDPALVASAWDGTGTPPVAGGGSTPTGSGGVLDLSWLKTWVNSFWDTFKAKMVELVSPEQSDLDAMTAAKNQILGWGPFGLVAEVKQEFDAASTSSGKTSSDPTYWYIPLRIAEFTSTPIAARPIGYDESVPVTPGASLTPSVARSNAAMANAAQTVPGSSARPLYYVPHVMGPDGRWKSAGAATTSTTVMDTNLWTHLIPDHWDLAPYSVGIVVVRSLAWASLWLFYGLSLKRRFTPELRI